VDAGKILEEELEEPVEDVGDAREPQMVWATAWLVVVPNIERDADDRQEELVQAPVDTYDGVHAELAQDGT